MLDAKSRVLITADGGYRRGRIIPLKETADSALEKCPEVEKVLVVRRTGDALTVVCTSWMNVEAMKAAEVLAKRGVALEVIDVRTVAPLETSAIIASVTKTRRCIVADYDWVFCGFSAELAATIAHDCFDVLKAPVERLGFAHVPCPTTRPLENLFYPSAVQIIRAAERMRGLTEADLRGDRRSQYLGRELRKQQRHDSAGQRWVQPGKRYRRQFSRRSGLRRGQHLGFELWRQYCDEAAGQRWRQLRDICRRLRSPRSGV